MDIRYIWMTVIPLRESKMKMLNNWPLRGQVQDGDEMKTDRQTDKRVDTDAKKHLWDERKE